MSQDTEHLLYLKLCDDIVYIVRQPLHVVGLTYVGLIRLLVLIEHQYLSGV